MTSRMYISRYYIPCTDGIDHVLDKLKNIPVLAEAATKLEERFVTHDFASLPPVTEEEVRSSCRPLEAEYVLDTSYQLLFTLKNTTIKIFIARFPEVYVAVKESKNKKKVKILGATSRTLGYDVLRKYLISSKLISKDVPTFPSRYYEPLDFQELSQMLQQYLLDGVTLTLLHTLPRKIELDQENVTCEYIDDSYDNCLEIYEYPDAIILALWMKYQEADEIHAELTKAGLEYIEFAFSEPSEVWSEFLETCFGYL